MRIGGVEGVGVEHSTTLGIQHYHVDDDDDDDNEHVSSCLLNREESKSTCTISSGNTNTVPCLVLHCVNIVYNALPDMRERRYYPLLKSHTFIPETLYPNHDWFLFASFRAIC